MFSAVVITLNEAENIAACLQPLLAVTDDVVVVDSRSTDATVQIATKLGARVVSVDWQGYSQTKNYANSLARYDWILSIDADEVVSPELQASLRHWQPRPQTVFLLDRFTNYCGTWVRHSGWYPDWKIRLFDRREVHWTGAYVHEDLYLPPAVQQVKLEGKLFHYSYRNSEDHWARIEKYAQLSAAKLYHKGKKATLWKVWFSPVARFLRTYFLKRGFLDGKTGWILSARNFYLVRRKYRLLRAMQQGKIEAPPPIENV